MNCTDSIFLFNRILNHVIVKMGHSGSMGSMGPMNRGLTSVREWIRQRMDRASGMDRVNGWIGPAGLIG